MVHAGEEGGEDCTGSFGESGFRLLSLECRGPSSLVEQLFECYVAARGEL